jgi:hypothetical protein
MTHSALDEASPLVVEIETSVPTLKTSNEIKVKNFVWLVYQNRIQTTNNLERKKWKGNKLGQLCVTPCFSKK